MRFENADIPLGGAWCSPCMRWQGLHDDDAFAREVGGSAGSKSRVSAGPRSRCRR
jgi:hypothetical protein